MASAKFVTPQAVSRFLGKRGFVRSTKPGESGFQCWKDSVLKDTVAVLMVEYDPGQMVLALSTAFSIHGTERSPSGHIVYVRARAENA